MDNRENAKSGTAKAGRVKSGTTKSGISKSRRAKSGRAKPSAQFILPTQSFQNNNVVSSMGDQKRTGPSVQSIAPFIDPNLGGEGLQSYEQNATAAQFFTPYVDPHMGEASSQWYQHHATDAQIFTPYVDQNIGAEVSQWNQQLVTDFPHIIQKRLCNLHLDESPRKVLETCLSVQTALSEASFSAILQQEKVSRQGRSECSKFLQLWRDVSPDDCPSNPSHVQLGEGATGVVFWPIDTVFVIKKEKPSTTHSHASGNLDLANDAIIHQSMIQHMAWEVNINIKVDFHVPGYIDYIAANDSEAFVNSWEKESWRYPDGHQQPANMLLSERIPPLPKIIRDALIKEYFPSHTKSDALADSKNADCLATLYLGKRWEYPMQVQDISLRKFPININHLEDLQLNTGMYAHAMAEALATMHWVTGINGRGVDFVLGGAPDLAACHFWTDGINSRDRLVHLWLLDFNECRPHSSFPTREDAMNSMVSALVDNDPYYPLPYNGQDELWEVFSKHYIEIGEKLMEGRSRDQGLPKAFIRNVKRRMRESLAYPGFGPPPSDFFSQSFVPPAAPLRLNPNYAPVEYEAYSDATTSSAFFIDASMTPRGWPQDMNLNWTPMEYPEFSEYLPPY